MARSAASRSTVGGRTAAAEPAKATIPTSSSGGASSRKLRAASRAASMRDGATSAASMESDTSMARITVAWSRGTSTATAGLATASTRASTPTRSTAAGRWRRHPGVSGATLSSSARLVNRTAYCSRRCRAAR